MDALNTNRHRPKTDTPHSVDIHIGRRVRERRKTLNLSQIELADALGITFQQVQKYERAANRISASRLYAIADVLKIPVAWFFKDIDSGITFFSDPHEGQINTFLATLEGFELARAFPRIKKTKTRGRVIDLMRSLADDDDET